jgi:diguanylate cyclase (GGDEF)-like protein/PAS domain S-box-containing protein
MLAVEFGRRVGVAAGVFAVGLFALWVELTSPEMDLVGYVSRLVVFVTVGAVTGVMAERLRGAVERAEESARHFELTRDLLCTVSFDGYITHLNDSWESALGWTAEELTSRPLVEFVQPDDRERTLEAAALAAAGDAPASFTNRLVTKDGRTRWIDWSSKADPEREAVYAVARDVTDRRATEEARREAEERFRRAFEDSAVGMAVVGIHGPERNRILRANDSLATIVGMSREELEGTRSLAELADPDAVDMIAAGMQQLSAGELALFRCEFQIVRPDTRRVWVDLTTSLVHDANGEPAYRLSQVVDIDARKQAADQLRYLADHDALSGVFNRRRFEQELVRELGHASVRDSQGAVLLLDVDKFKSINDTYGHAMGDAVIARLGETLSSRLRTSDVVARLGGDEFAVLLRRVEPRDAHDVARNLRELVLARLGDLDGGGLASVTVSVGVASFGGDDVPGPDELLMRADHAMYEAKRAGGDRVSLHAGS